MTTIVVMGVAGVGKSTVGRALAEARGAAFVEGDDFHPEANVAKMSRGEPLDDDDRRPWLTALGREIDRLAAAGDDVVVACSALKRAYRDRLREGRCLMLVHLICETETIAGRLAGRQGHFMAPALLESQLATLELPGDDEEAVVVDASGTPAGIVERVLLVAAQRR